MENLKDLLEPKTLNRKSYVAVIFWILFGVTLFGIFADIENSESRFDFRCRGAKSENIDFVRGKCFQIYVKTYNQFTIPVYGFVIVNFFLIGIVCLIYSQIVKSTVEQLLEANPNGDAARQSPDEENPTRRKLFTAYCCQLSARLVLGILFIVLQTQLLYPSKFPSNFNCHLTSGGNQPRNSSATGPNSITLHECHNQRATKKNFWMNVVLALNVIFALLILIETICILSRARKGTNFMEDRQFLNDHLKSIPPQRESEELQQHRSLFINSLEIIVEEKEKLPDRSPFQRNPGEGKTKHPTVNQIYTNLVVIENRAMCDKLASGNLLNRANILKTTRPTAVSTVRDYLIDKTMEIQGFTSEKIEEYVDKFTGEDTQAGEKLKQHIKSNINIFSLFYIPLNCFIVCSCLFQMLKFYGGVSLPTKLTEIYKRAVKLFFYKHNEEFRDKTFTREDFESNDLPPEVEEQFKRLGKVAFNGIEEGKLIFARNEVQGLEDSALFYRLPDRQTGPFEHEEQFCFIHLTIQEFFAAMHITQNMNETELRKFVADHIGDGKWVLVLQFVAGLLGDGDKPSSEIFTYLLPEETEERGGENSEDKLTCWPTADKRHLAVNLYKYIYENSKLDSVVESKLEHMNFNFVNFSNCGLTPADCPALVNLIKNVQQISRIDLDGNNIGSLGCAEICKLLVNRNSQLRWLNLSWNGITDEAAQHLSEALRNENCKLQVLLLMGNNISDTGAQHFSEALRNENCKLQELDLSHNNISDTGAQHLSEALRNENCMLQELHLSDNNISDTAAQHFSEALRDEICTLQVLDLSQNYITTAGEQHLREVINKTQSNGKLHLL